MPTPMNESAASVKIASGMPKVTATTIGRQRVGQDVATQEPAEAGAEGAGAVDELLLLEREHLGARLAGDAHPAR